NKRLRAVDRVENPHVFGVRTLGSVFLTQDSMARELLADERAHALLRCAVRLGDRIEATGLFVLDRQGGAKKRKDCIAGRGGKLIDEAAEVDGCHAAPPVVCLPPIGPCAPRQRRDPAVSPNPKNFCCGAGFHVGCFRMGRCLKTCHGQQPCENSMGNTALNLDFCASRCSLLQCGSESYRCPPWAFPP